MSTGFTGRGAVFRRPVLGLGISSSSIAGLAGVGSSSNSDLGGKERSSCGMGEPGEKTGLASISHAGAVVEPERGSGGTASTLIS